MAMQGVMRDLAKIWSAGVFGEGEAATQANENAARESGGKYAIKEIGDTGKYYVQASRQVLFGDDSDAWGEQLTRYINREIRRGNDVALSTADGDILKLTQTTAEKGAFRNVWYDKNGRAHVYTDEEYRAKLDAEAHIDELTTISVDKSPARPNKPDYNNLHGDFAKNGWRYRNAHFMDFDGTYYKLTISAAYGNDGKVVYNVANMDKDTFSSVTGSSSIKAGAQGGKVSSDLSISEDKLSVKEESQQTQEAMANPDSKIRTPDGKHRVVYHGTSSKATPHDSAIANPKKNQVPRKAIIHGNTMCIARKKDEVRVHFFQEAPMADCAVLP